MLAIGDAGMAGFKKLYNLTLSRYDAKAIIITKQACQYQAMHRLNCPYQVRKIAVDCLSLSPIFIDQFFG